MYRKLISVLAILISSLGISGSSLQSKGAEQAAPLVQDVPEASLPQPTREWLIQYHMQSTKRFSTAAIFIAQFLNQNPRIPAITVISPDGTGLSERDVINWAVQGGDTTPVTPEAVKSALATVGNLPASEKAADFTSTLLLSINMEGRIESREYDSRQPPKELRQFLETLGMPWFVPADK